MQSHKFSPLRNCLHILAIALTAITFSLTVGAHAQTETVLYDFFSRGTNGYGPYSGLIFDTAGNLYGTTYYGGTFGHGTVFKLAPVSGGGWQESILYSFTGGADGGEPYRAGLVFDAAGNLYGTTYYGGDLRACSGFGCGTVFKLAPVSGGWQESVLCSFTGGTDGGNPLAGLIFDAAGNLYGTTFGGGLRHACSGSGCGTVFKLTPSSSGTWQESVLHSFNGTTDGGNPHASLTFDAAGNLYGTTYWGGNPSVCPGSNCGTVFRLKPSSGGAWKEKVLHAFTGGTDGSNPSGGVIFDLAGNLYGTTTQGGRLNYCSQVGCGTVFKLTPSSSGAWKGKVLRAFFGQGDGAGPQAGLIFDASGNLYGTTIGGSRRHVDGVVFKLTPSSSGFWKQTVLHGFSGAKYDGANPAAGLIFDTSGNLYGTTTTGGPGGCGVVFKITP